MTELYEIFFLIILIVILIKSTSSAVSKKRRIRLPFGYKLIYTDQKGNKRLDSVVYSKFLYSKKYGLRGKPDFIYQRGRDIIPVEIKSGTLGSASMPHRGDLYQLAAYFFIIEEEYGIRPQTGRLIYSDCMFIIYNNKEIRREFMRILKQMNTMLKTGKEKPVCDFAHCRHCVCRLTVCEFAKK